MTYNYVHLEATTSKKVATGRYLFRVVPLNVGGILYNRFELLNPNTLRTVYASGGYLGRYIFQLSDKEFLVETLGGTRHRIRFE